MTYKGCYNAEFVKFDASRMDLHSAVAQFVGACQVDT